MKTTMCAGILVLASLGWSQGYGQDYPAKPVRLIAPFAPGGTSDTLGRIVSEHMGRRLNQSFVVENRPGAGGIIGSDVVAKAPPDGYTLLVSGIGSHVVAPAMSKVSWDPMKSFTHIALFGGPPTGLLVGPAVQARTVAEFIAWAKSQPKGVAFASSSYGSHAHLIGELFAERTGARLVHIPYKGGSPAVADVVAGHVPSSFTAVTSAAPQVRAGRARFLAMTSEERLADFPDVPTFSEVGLPDLVAITWFGLSGPAGMPRAIVNRLNAEVRAALQLPEVRERLAGDGIAPNNLDADAYTAFFQKEIDRWAPIARRVAQTETEK